MASIRATIAMLESCPGQAEDVSKARSKASTAEQNQTNDLKVLDRTITAMQNSFQEMQKNIQELSEILDGLRNLPFIKTISGGVTDTKVRLASIEQHSIETSTRLAAMELEGSHDTLKLQEQSSCITEWTASVQFLQTSLLDLANSQDVEILRAELNLNALSEDQNAASQQKVQDPDALAALTSAIDDFSMRFMRLDQACESFASETRTKLEQHSNMIGGTVQNNGLDGVCAVVDALCQRLSIIENGFQMTKNATIGRRR